VDPALGCSPPFLLMPTAARGLSGPIHYLKTNQQLGSFRMDRPKTTSRRALRKGSKMGSKRSRTAWVAHERKLSGSLLQLI
jgi:hypothetical protein